MSLEQEIINIRYVIQKSALIGFEDRATNQLISYYRKAVVGAKNDLKRLIKQAGDVKDVARLRLLLNTTDAVIEELGKKLIPPAVEVVGQVGAFTAKDTNAILSWDGKNKTFKAVGMSANQISAMIQKVPIGEKTLSGRLLSIVTDENNGLKAEIMAARIRGVGYRKLIDEIGSRYDNLLGKKGSAESNLETVVRTYMQSMNNMAHANIYAANKDVVEEVEWSAILENGNTGTGKGTCPRCAALDGNTYKASNSGRALNGPDCPLHSRCRCMYIPKTKTWEELGFGSDIPEMKTEYTIKYERARNYLKNDPNLPQDEMTRERLKGKTTYKDFWLSKPSYWQDNAIGPVRANLVRSRAVQFDNIVDKETGNLINLKDLSISEEQLTESRRR